MDRPAAWRESAVDLEAERPFRIGGATVDPISRDATYEGGHERLQPQTLKVLIALKRRIGEVVTRSELIDSCWGGRIVGEDVINRSISILRDFAERSGGFAIETIPKAGYRLVEQSGDPRMKRVRRCILPAVLLIAIVGGLWAFTAWRKAPDGRVPIVALRPLTSSSDLASREVAVATGDALSHMMVAGSFHGRVEWPANARDEAKSDLILTGDVRRSGNSLVALMQLRDRRTDTLIYSQRFEAAAADAAILPEQIGAQISSNLTGALALMVLARRHSGSPELTAEKLKSIAITVAEQDPLVSYQISRRLEEGHPEWVLSQLGVAYDTAFALSSLPRHERPEAVRKARTAADRALKMAPDFGDTYVPWCLLRPQYVSRECEDRLRAGMKADPDAPFAPVFLSSLLFSSGRFEESSQFARTGLAGDPFHPHKLRRVVRTLIVLGQKEEAEQIFAQAIRWWPTHEGLYWDRLNAYSLAGDLDGGEKAIQGAPPSVLERPRKQVGAMLSAYRARDLKRVRVMCLAPEAGYLLQSYCLTALHKLRDDEAALKLADRLFPRVIGATPVESEAMWIDDPELGLDPLLSAPASQWLRSTPQFLPMAQRSGALDYWRNDRLPDFCRRQLEPVCVKFKARAWETRK